MTQADQDRIDATELTTVFALLRHAIASGLWSTADQIVIHKALTTAKSNIWNLCRNPPSGSR
jgi:hypothetical protein